jgi:hypothetical protein
MFQLVTILRILQSAIKIVKDPKMQQNMSLKTS